MERKSIPLADHLEAEGWTRDELVTAAADVRVLMETPGWAAIERSIKDRLRFEQHVVMMSGASGDAAKYERSIGQWNGLRQIGAIAEGIVQRGEAVEHEQRGAA